MKEISSRENPRYKELKRLATSTSARERAGHSLLEGIHLCAAWLAARGGPELCIVGKGALAHPEVAAVVAQLDGSNVLLLDDALCKGLTQVEQGIGLLFLVTVPRPVMPAQWHVPCLLLDRLQDPGNLGSILRSAAAAGVSRVFCSRGTVAAWSPKLLRAGMGAHFLLDIHEDADLGAIIEQLRLPLCAMSSHASASLYDSDVRDVAWLFGNEGQGVAPDLLRRDVRVLAIPQPGGMESLNVAAAAAICLFEQVRQQRLSQQATP